MCRDRNGAFNPRTRTESAKTTLQPELWHSLPSLYPDGCQASPEAKTLEIVSGAALFEKRLCKS